VYLTTGEVATALHVTIPTIKRWVKDGHIAAFKTAGGHYRITDEELDRFRAVHQMPGQLIEDVARILVVEDNIELRNTLAAAYAPDGRFKVELAEDGYEGLIKVGSFRPHLLILDIRMPGLDGFGVCRNMKKDPAAMQTKILAMTGYVEDGVKERIIEAGADGFIEKPVSLAVVDAEIEHLLGISIDREAMAASARDLHGVDDPVVPARMQKAGRPISTMRTAS
jgi:excisionase family DNA binding protein